MDVNEKTLEPYEALVHKVLTQGTEKGDRTGTGTVSLFGQQLRYDLSKGFPLITTKKVNYNAVIGELIWFLRGDTNISYLKDNNINIWNEWADEYGFLGSIYGSQWRQWYHVADEYIKVDRVHVDNVDNSPYVFDEENVKTRVSPFIESLWVYLKEDNLISGRWRTFSVFYEEIRRVPGFNQWYRNTDEYEIAPFYYGSSKVNENSAIFLPLWYWEELRKQYTYEDHNEKVLTRRKVFYDQIEDILHTLKTNPESRRIILNAWNVAEIDNMALPPCHTMFQFYVENGKLSGQLYQRSADLFLGVPFNIASYSLLIHMVARKVGLDVGEFVWTGGDCHIYSNHIEQVHTMLTREHTGYPEIMFANDKETNLEDYNISDISFKGYNPHSFIAGKVAV